MTKIADLSLEERRHEFILKSYEFSILESFLANEFIEDPYDDDLMECFNYYLENQAGLYIHPDHELKVMELIEQTRDKMYDDEESEHPHDAVWRDKQYRDMLCTIINTYTTAVTFISNRTSETITYSELDRRIGWSILCNNMESRWWTTMDVVSWSTMATDEFGRETDHLDIFQYYIISDSWADYLKRCTDEIVFYDEELDIYVWWITHLGTSWDYVYVTISY